MKVPTFQKFGLTKARLNYIETKDKKISDILTHHLTIGIGIIFGMILYVLYFTKTQPSTFVQILFQIFIFASVGIICVGIPAVLFKLAEMFYFKHIKQKSDEYKTIEKYKEERDNYDFWKLRKDFSFWKLLDGLSFEKELMSIYLHLGYNDKIDLADENLQDDRVMEFENALYYFHFYTRLNKFNDTAHIDLLLERCRQKNCQTLCVFSQSGFEKNIYDYSSGQNIKLLDIKEIIKIVKSL
jgi:hypothetical protein